MDDMVTIYGDGEDEYDKKLSEIFGRYLRGEINMEECERLQNEVLDMRNKQRDKELAAIRADAEGDTP